jgi:hypothetical protein
MCDANSSSLTVHFKGQLIPALHPLLACVQCLLETAKPAATQPGNTGNAFLDGWAKLTSNYPLLEGEQDHTGTMSPGQSNVALGREGMVMLMARTGWHDLKTGSLLWITLTAKREQLYAGHCPCLPLPLTPIHESHTLFRYSNERELVNSTTHSIDSIS